MVKSKFVFKYLEIGLNHGNFHAFIVDFLALTAHPNACSG